jgi:hypothetical protein
MGAFSKAAGIIACSLVTLALSGCVGGRGYHDIPAEGPPPAPPVLVLAREQQVAALHFPPGMYSLRAADDRGYYYAAPRPILEHTAIGPRPYEGGIYVDRRDQAKLRGYVIWGGVRTHVGDLSRARHEFRRQTDQPDAPRFQQDEQQ